MSRIILVDVDDTLNNLLTGWTARYNADYNDNISPETFTDWNMIPFVKPECGEKIYKYLDDPTLYLECQPVEHSQEVVQRLLDNGDKVYAVSSCVPGSIDPKFKWVLQHYPLTWKQLIACTDKSRILGDIMIDDGVHNSVGFNGRFILMTREHNKKHGGFERVNDWYEIEEKLC